MGLDGLFLSKLLKELKTLENEYVGKIYQIGTSEFIFNVGKEKLFISLDRNSYRINLTKNNYLTPKEATLFSMVLRKYFEGGKITSIEQFKKDRIITITVLNKNEIGDKKALKLILELMGKNANMIITDKDDIIIDAYKKIGVSLIGKTILPKAKYLYQTEDKLDIFEDSYDISLYQDKKALAQAFLGLSPLVINKILEANDKLKLIEDLKVNSKAVIIDNNGKEDFYFYPLSRVIKEYESLSSLLDNFYYQKTIKDLKSSKYSNLEQIVKRELKKNQKKLDNLNDDLNTSIKNQEYLNYANLIKANLYQFKDEKMDEITLFDYTKNQDVKINLDDKLSVKENMQEFYKIANKAKNSISFINHQIELTIDKIDYFNLLLTQVGLADLKDLEEIYLELKEQNIINDHKKIKGKNKIELYSESLDGIKIYVGKNNKQNDYLTNHLAKPNYMWFHVKDAPGSHVVICKEDSLSEKEIRYCAKLAAKYSFYKDSSSVAVIYTKVRNIKKIPGKMNCFVNYANEKAIFIDPND